MSEKEFRVRVSVDTTDVQAARALASAQLKAEENEEKRLAMLTEKLAKEKADAKVKEEKRAVSEAERLGKQLLTEEQVQSRARMELNRQVNRDKIKEATEAFRKEKEGHSEVNSLMESGVDRLKALVGAYAGLHGAKVILGTIVDIWEQIRQKQLQAAQGVMDYRDQLRAVTALEGTPGAPTNAVLEHLRRREVTGTTGQEESTFTEQFESAAGSVINKKISRGEASKLATKALLFSTQAGISPQVMGQAAGAIPQVANGQTDAMTVMRQILQGEQFLNPGEGSLESLIGQAMPLAGALVGTGGLQSTGELFGLTSLASHFGARDIKTTLESLVRTSTAFGKNRRLKFEDGDINAESMAEWYKDTKIDPDNRNVLGNYIKLIRSAEAAEQKAKGEGREFNVRAFLAEKGVVQQHDRETFAGFYAHRQELYGIPGQAAQMPTAEDVNARLSGAASSDVIQNRRAQQSQEISQAVKGLQFEPALRMFKRAETEAINKGYEDETGYSLEARLTGLTSGRSTWFGTGDADKYGKSVMESALITQHLRNVASRYGLDQAAMGVDELSAPRRYSPEQLTNTIERFQQAGVNDPYSGLGDVTRKLDEANKHAAEQTRIMRENRRRPLPAAPGGGRPTEVRE